MADRDNRLGAIDGCIRAVNSLFSEKTVRWLSFGVAFSTLPIVASCLLAVTQNLDLTPDSILGRGELLITSAGVAASGAGELQGVADEAMKRVKIIVTAIAYLIVCATSLWFASVATSIASKVPVQEHTVTVGSVIFFVSSVVAGLSCVALSGAE